MDGGFGGGGEDGRGLHALSGVVTDWDGRVGKIITNNGECVVMHRLLLRMLGVREPLQVGARVQLWAREEVRVTYVIEEVGEIVPQEPDPRELDRLRSLHRAVERQRTGEEDEPATVEGCGIVETFVTANGTGTIRRDDGTRVLLHITCLRASGFRGAIEGSAVRFEAIEQRRGWFAYRILSLDPPPDLR